VHTRISFDLASAEGIRSWRSFLEEAADLVVSYGGALSGEHGDGQARAELLPRMFGEELVQAFREFKTIWDPAWKLNPGKVVDPFRVDENLRLGAGYGPPRLATHFAYPEDDGSFAHSALRCIGVGKCRHTEGGTMCPSFMVTREEQHSTRGRARLLFDMLNGELDGWRSTEVLEALDLCLACKGCKRDCPVSVDLASYKAEFLSHHYAGRLRPRSAYTLGLIYWWARLASRAPALVNTAAQRPPLARVLKGLAGVAPERELPRFATETFRDWFHARAPTAGGAEIVLWPDTFTNHFHPEVGRAAVEVLEAAGFRPTLPGRPLCCGRPLYDWGMLDLAKRLLRQTLETLASGKVVMNAGSPKVVKELERHGVEVIQVDCSESHRFAIAGLHCATLELVRDQPAADLPERSARNGHPSASPAIH
jgi:ferredoxin